MIWLGNVPKIITFDMTAEIGLEVSATYSFGGKIEFINKSEKFKSNV